MTNNLEDLKQAVKASWWALLLSGIVVGVIGFLLLAHPEKTLIVMVQLLAIGWLVHGVLGIGSSFMGGEGWGWRLFGGVIGLLAGLFVLAHPLFSAAITPVMLVYLIALTAMLNGISEMIFGRRVGVLGTQWSWGSFFVGLLNVVIGVFLFAHTLVSAGVLVSVVGVLSIVAGIALVIFAFQIRGAASAT